MSLDTPMLHHQDPTTTTITTGNGKVSTNPGYQQQQQKMRETQMRGLPRPGQRNNLEDIFEDSSTFGQIEKDFGDFGPADSDGTFFNTFEPLSVGATTMSMPSGQPCRPSTPPTRVEEGRC